MPCGPAPVETGAIQHALKTWAETASACVVVCLPVCCGARSLSFSRTIALCLLCARSFAPSLPPSCSPVSSRATPLATPLSHIHFTRLQTRARVRARTHDRCGDGQEACGEGRRVGYLQVPGALALRTVHAMHPGAEEGPRGRRMREWCMQACAMGACLRTCCSSACGLAASSLCWKVCALSSI